MNVYYDFRDCDIHSSNKYPVYGYTLLRFKNKKLVYFYNTHYWNYMGLKGSCDRGFYVIPKSRWFRWIYKPTSFIDAFIYLFKK